MKNIPIYDLTGQDAFGVRSAPFKAITGVATGGLAVGTLVANATLFATLITGVIVIAVAINAIDGIYGKDIRKSLKKEENNGKKK